MQVTIIICIFNDGSHICGGECLNCGALNDENLRGSYHSGL